MNFKDYFSDHSSEYATYRPDYPSELFSYLAKLTPEHSLAWDCATGNGQAAVALADYFDQVVATDASVQQIQSAITKKNITYRVMPAEKTVFTDHSVDLITVAQALHWFDLNKFYDEVKRILKPNGVIAVWCYTLPRIDQKIDKIIDHLYWEVTKEYWDKARSYIDEEYKTIDFPFKKIITPNFQIEKSWDLRHFIGYLMTWSGLKNYIAKKNENPIEKLMPQFIAEWGELKEIRKISWPICLLAGKQNDQAI